MTSNLEALQESRDSWIESAEHDRKQALLSFVMSSAGVICAGVGEYLWVKGNLAGTIPVVLGCVQAIVFAGHGVSEINNSREMMALAEARQATIDHHTN